MKQRLRKLPAVHRILDLPRIKEALVHCGRPSVLRACRQALEEYRQDLRTEVPEEPPGDQEVLGKIEERCLQLLAEFSRPSYAGLINATGVLLHTNLGRAPAAAEFGTESYLALEFDLESGKRGQRLTPIRKRIERVCGAEAAVMVNNNAASLLLILQAIASGREVIVSRSQLIEIGGSFRLPNIMKAAGCTLVEVGCTNRTHLRDFEEALSDRTAAILVAHQSNFQILGFTASPRDSELAELAHRHSIPFIVDQGSGCLHDLRQWGLAREKTVFEYLDDGADIVCFSGDKLLGGPQAGLIVGKAEWVQPLGRHPLYRALRPGKLALSAMDRVLEAHSSGHLEEIPLYELLMTPAPTLKKRAQRLRRRLHSSGLDVELCSTMSTLGGGTTPGSTFPSWGIRIQGGRALLKALRMTNTPVIGCVEEDRVILDLRTVRVHEDSSLEKSLLEAHHILKDLGLTQK